MRPSFAAHTRALCAAVVLLASPALAEIPAPEGMAVLTLGGEVAQSNRGPSTAEDLSVLGKMELVFDQGVEFDTAMLAGLEQAEITTKVPGSDRSGTFSGPKLSALLTEVGASGKTALPMALDGYQVELPWDLIAAHEPILATHLDGKPLGIGTFGPTMTIFPATDDAELAEQFAALQVWATFYIGVE